MYSRKLSTVLCVILLSCFSQPGASDPPNGNDPDECLQSCLDEMQQKAPDLTAAQVLSIGHIRSGSDTVVCPKYDPAKMSSTCQPFITAKECLNKCPESPMKNLSTSGFAPLQMVCIDRKDDVERHMPCLSDTCPSAEAACVQPCGSFDDLSKDMLSLISQVRGSGDPNSDVRIDPNNVTMTIAHACESIQCYSDCSRNATAAKCGETAYNLEIDITWKIFVSMTQSVSSIGLSTPWPDSCTTLAHRDLGITDSETSGAGPAVVPTVPIEIETTTRSNAVEQFISRDQQTSTISSTTTTCVGPNCNTATGMASSIFVLTLCFITAIVISN